MMALEMAYHVETYSSGTHGRAICNARTHHWVADDGGGDAVGAGELFLSGITACAVNMVERIALTDDAPVDFMEVSAEAFRDSDTTPGDVSLYADVRIHFKIWGVDDDQGNYLVDTWKKRCPLYGSVAVATPNTSVTAEFVAEPRPKHAGRAA